MFEVGQCATPQLCFAKTLISSVVDPDRVREPDILAHPVHFLHVPDRAMPELLQAELFLVFGLGQMGVQVNAIFTRQLGGLLHQVAGHAEGRARRQDDLHHRTGFGIVIFLDQPLGILQDGVFAVHHGIRRQSALRFAQGHRAARGLDAQSDLLRRGDLVVQLGAVGEEIEMVGGGGAARKRQLGEGGLGRDEDVFRRQARPDGIERLQPVEEIGILRRRDGARQGLVEVMVRVDQPRQDDVTVQVEDFVGMWQAIRSVGPTCSMKPSRIKRPPSGISR